MAFEASVSFASDVDTTVPTPEEAATPALNSISFGYNHDSLNQDFDAWNQLSFDYSRRTRLGTVIGRINEANRFNTFGTQYEVDAYPKIAPGIYAYFNFGYSAASIFPRYRLGGELYKNLSHGWETSLGFRHLVFESSKVTIVTGTVGKYLGNWYLLVRGNLIPDASGSSTSGSLQIRRYFGDVNYVSITGGAGRSPSLISYLGQVVVLRSRRAGIDGKYEIAPTWFSTLGLVYLSDEIRPEVFRRDISCSAGIQKNF